MRLEFSQGLNVLTGETGAGKSIIIDALGLLMGERIKNDYIRDENYKAIIEAVFDITSNEEVISILKEQGLLDDDSQNVVICREISNSRNAVRINGRNVNVSTLKNLSSHLVDMHLQNERQNILRPSMYLHYVDCFAVGQPDLLAQLSGLYCRIVNKRQQLEALQANKQERLQRLDFLAYQIKEIETSKLYEEEEEELRELRDRIKNSKRLMQASDKIQQLLYLSENNSSAYDMISNALDISIDLRDDSFFAQLVEPLESIYYSMQDLSQQVSAFKAKLDFEPDLLEQTEDRLYEISKLKNKYGITIHDIFSYLAKAKQEWQVLEQGQDSQEVLDKEVAELTREYTQLAWEISENRKNAARLLEEKVQDELLELNMPDIRFQVVISERVTPSEKGIDEIDFLFSPNPGEELRSIARIASGGEISRFVLALKKALAEIYDVPTLIFDEIDVGLGGSALNSTARKISELSKDHQVILVTHSPQVAKYADQHFVIEKYVLDDKTFTSVKRLQENEKAHEIARMLDGDDYSALTLEHARQLMKNGDSSLIES